MTDEEYLSRVDPGTLATLVGLPETNLSGDINDVRRRAEELFASIAPLLPTVTGVSERDVFAPGPPGAPDVRLRIYAADGRPRPSAAVLWIHGGGLVMGTLDRSDFQCRALAARQNTLVVSVDYRLAPETPAPGAAEDCYSALLWLASAAEELGVDPARLVVVGGSAGGNLAAATALLARDRGGPPLRAQVLHYPMLDDRNLAPSTHAVTYARTWHRAANLAGWSAYLGSSLGSDEVSIYAAPGRAKVAQLRGLPPTFIDVGELDIFRDESISYAQSLLHADVTVELLVTPGAWHGSETFCPDAPSSRRINALRSDAIARALAQD